ncbi:hypothetical protein Purlil1_13741 [Purpureocillium lilacinum]|uniref:Uncharacterized protein n=1 Tax=Purpureocillium lilacinum TaxID=33203 RepID=A0ABR0BD89_PURLI|nr:hypothetical protein Purlil1_13741 [Purpureocillium lilacinum]
MENHKQLEHDPKVCSVCHSVMPAALLPSHLVQNHHYVVCPPRASSVDDCGVKSPSGHGPMRGDLEVPCAFHPTPSKPLSSPPPRPPQLASPSNVDPDAQAWPTPDIVSTPTRPRANSWFAALDIQRCISLTAQLSGVRFPKESKVHEAVPALAAAQLDAQLRTANCEL